MRLSSVALNEKESQQPLIQMKLECEDTSTNYINPSKCGLIRS